MVRRGLTRCEADNVWGRKRRRRKNEKAKKGEVGLEGGVTTLPK